MAWREVSRTTTEAPRNLQRRDHVPNPYHLFGGGGVDDRAPSVGGVVHQTHVVWKHSCGAYACGLGDVSPPAKCGKCHHP